MKASKPLVSILMPYYNFGNFLAEAVQSVLAQTYQNWELVVVDDCAPKEPAAGVLSNFTDSRIHLFRHETNRRVGAARNTAAANSKGDFLLPLDSDDLLAPDYIERTVETLLDEGVSAVYTDVKIFGKQEIVCKPATDLCEIFTGHFPYNTFLMKRETFDEVGGYNIDGLAEDTDFWISAIEAGTKFAYVPAPLYLYRRHPDSLSQRRKLEMLSDFFTLMARHHTSVATHLPKILESWVQVEERRMEQKKATENLAVELAHLKKEFSVLKERFDNLERKVSRNEKILDSIPQLTRQAFFLAMKHHSSTQAKV